MKKFIIICACFLVVGCHSKKEPLKDTADKIQESKIVTVKLQIENMFKEAEIKWLEGDIEKCIEVSNLVNASSATGLICIDENNNFYTDGIEYQNYKCSGTRESITCVGGSND